MANPDTAHPLKRALNPLRERWRQVIGQQAPRPYVAPEAMEFQSDLEVVIAEPAPPILGRPHLVVAGMLVLAGIVASLIQVDMVVVAPGRLVTQSPPIILQPMALSIVTEMRVKPGEVVRQGQVLATLDPTFTAADRSSLSSQQKTLFALLRRLELESAGKPLPDSMTRDPDPDMVLQTTLFHQRSAQYQSRLAAFDGQISSDETALRSAEDDEKSLSQQLDVAQDVENLRAELFKGQTGSRLQLLEARSVRLETERSLQATRNKIQELRFALAARRAERQNFVDDWQRQLLEQLVETRRDAAQVDEALTKAVRMNDLVELTAPADAIVQEVAKRSNGSIAREAEALITLIPLDSPLLADVTIGSADIGYVRLGDEVEVKVDPFPFQRHGMLKGRMRSISQESYVVGATGEQLDALRSPVISSAYVHKAQVELLTTELRRMPEGTALTAGMTVRAEIKVGSRSVMSYFLYPILRGLDESIREP